MAHEVQEVGRVLAVVNGEGGAKAHRTCIYAQEPGTHGMERARPRNWIFAGSRFANGVGDNALRPALHVGGSPPREGQKQDAAGIGTVHDQVGDPMRQRIGLPQSGPGNDEQRARNVCSGCSDAMLDGTALLGI
jgi:hypothetical protein